MKNKNILVTGGSGFLGSHVADALTDQGYKVTIFDQKESKWLKDDQEMIVGDILDQDLVTKIVKDKFAIYHFAAIAGLKEANDNPAETIKYNILGTTNLLEAAVAHNISRFIFASSVYVYSEHGGFYRATKQSCELLIENYNKIKNLDYSILRFGSLYGTRANSFNWIHNIIVQALTEKKMIRKGSGEEVRDYIHVSDASNSCVQALDDKYKNKYLMLTGFQRIKIKELLEMISEIINKDIDIVYLDEKLPGHYNQTPFSFKPRVASKINLSSYRDLGEGILDSIYEIYNDLKKRKIKTINMEKKN